MIKRNKIKLIISSVVTLIPMLIGFFADKILPENIAVHWNLSGEADGFGSPKLIFILIPLILLAVHWLCVILTSVMDKGNEQNDKVMGLVFWIIPVISLSSCGMVFATALGYASKIGFMVLAIIGAAFIIVGNYMPKTTRNLTMGIKIKWAQANDENWQATHRFGGKIMVAAGFACLLAMPLPEKILPFLFIAIILCIAILPTVYSYRFYKRQLAEGKVTKEDYEAGYKEIVKNPKQARAVIIVISVLLAILLFFLMFVGEVETTVGDDSLTLDATFWQETTINYEDIDSIELRGEKVGGIKVGGFNSAKLLLGTFQNEEFGVFTRYTYTKSQTSIVLRVDERVIVIGEKTDETTRALYEELSAKIAK